MTDIAAQRVLVVEDDRKISDLLQNYLRASGYVAEAAYDGRDALRQIERQVPDAVILDWMLPGLDGISVCKSVRAFSDVPILMLTARIDEVDRLLGLDTGADDYVCKPFAPREVIARIRALLRRAEGRVKTSTKPWEIDDASFRISWRGQWLPLTPTSRTCAKKFRPLTLVVNASRRCMAWVTALTCRTDPWWPRPAVVRLHWNLAAVRA